MKDRKREDKIDREFDQETSERCTVNKDDENFITIHRETAADCIPTKTWAKCSVTW